ncbi:MAG: hypothetical protein IKF17_03190 [Clostridia bacterium]|nr:hypothetical protein [Clostridia bacterium]
MKARIIVYHYKIRYCFEDKKKSEIGYGSITYDTITKIGTSSFDVLEDLEREIAYERKHENVSITCYSLIKAEFMS